MPRYRSPGLPVSEETLSRWAIPLMLTAAGFVGGVAIAVFYNVVLSPMSPDSIQRANKVTMTGPYPSPAEPVPSYPSIGQVFHAPATDGRGGDTMDSPEARARAQAARLEKSRIDKIMQICTGC